MIDKDRHFKTKGWGAICVYPKREQSQNMEACPIQTPWSYPQMLFRLNKTHPTIKKMK